MPAPGTIVVVIVDDQNIAKADVPVNIRAQNTNIHLSGTTEKDGKIKFDELAYDTYEVAIQYEPCCFVVITPDIPRKCACAVMDGGGTINCSECQCS